MTAMGREGPKAPPVAVAKKGLTLKQFVESHWETYQRNRGIMPSTRDSQAATLKNHILPVLGSVEISDITSMHISEFLRGLADKHLSPKTVLNVYQLLHAMFEGGAVGGADRAEVPVERGRAHPGLPGEVTDPTASGAFVSKPRMLSGRRRSLN